MSKKNFMRDIDKTSWKRVTISKGLVWLYNFLKIL